MREVEEETGLRCALGPELAGRTIETPRGRRVRQRAMKTECAELAGDGADDWTWLPPQDAEEQLTWERDVPVLRSPLEAA